MHVSMKKGFVPNYGHNQNIRALEKRIIKNINENFTPFFASVKLTEWLSTINSLSLFFTKDKIVGYITFRAAYNWCNAKRGGGSPKVIFNQFVMTKLGESVNKRVNNDDTT